MNRMLTTIAIAVAGCGVAVPAVLGLSGNPSFSQRIHVPVPSQAHLVQYDRQGHLVDDGLTPAGYTTTPSTSRTSAPGRTVEAGDDHGGARTSGSGEPEPGDDHGGRSGAGTSTHRSTSTARTSEPGDDHGGRKHGSGGSGGDDGTTGAGTTGAGSTTSGSDDRGGHGGHGSDDD